MVIETISTFTSDAPGAALSNVTPSPGTYTMRIHHSFLKAPTGYTPRVADSRIGVSAIRFKDFSKPADDNPDTQWITRWRLEKKDPGAAMSEPKKLCISFLISARMPFQHRSSGPATLQGGEGKTVLPAPARQSGER